MDCYQNRAVTERGSLTINVTIFSPRLIFFPGIALLEVESVIIGPLSSPRNLKCLVLSGGGANPCKAPRRTGGSPFRVVSLLGVLSLDGFRFNLAIGVLRLSGRSSIPR